MALVILAGVGALVASLQFVAILSRRSASAMLELVREQYTAESRANMVASDLTVAETMTVPVSLVPVAFGDGELTRYGTYIWLAVGGSNGERGVVRRVGRVITARPPALAIEQGLATPGSVVIDGTTTIEQLGTAAGGFCSAEAAVREAPDFSASGYEVLDEWLGRADFTLGDGVRLTPAPAVTGDQCQIAAMSNWGDPVNPMSPCASHYPMVAVSGNAVIEGGVGQGGLLVVGNLTIRAGFRFRGLVLVGGSLTVEGGGAWLEGAVQVSDENATGSFLTDARITYSACGLRAALARFGELSVVDRNAWFQMF